jgi:hypothetical protein
LPLANQASEERHVAPKAATHRKLALFEAVAFTFGGVYDVWNVTRPGHTGEWRMGWDSNPR